MFFFQLFRSSQVVRLLSLGLAVLLLETFGYFFVLMIG